MMLTKSLPPNQCPFDNAPQVQRPNIFKLAEVDLAILRTGAGWLKKARHLRSDLPGIVDEFGEKLYEELDYVHEAANCQKFRKLYGSLEGIAAPEIVDSLTTKRVLVMEWIEGTKQPQWGTDAERLICLGLECSVYQLLQTGFLHSDVRAIEWG
jgi:predicted unusual protein kinase regulating ubiquinone biosynthesis (AarF/ABC1/UbiB family)